MIKGYARARVCNRGLWSCNNGCWTPGLAPNKNHFCSRSFCLCNCVITRGNVADGQIYFNSMKGQRDSQIQCCLRQPYVAWAALLDRKHTKNSGFAERAANADETTVSCHDISDVSKNVFKVKSMIKGRFLVGVISGI